MKVEVTRGWIGRQVMRRYKVRRKTKAVTIVVQEVYLRDDIPCGSALCRSCVQESPPLSANRSHYLNVLCKLESKCCAQFPDADALLQFLEIWELPQITSVIYLASVIKEPATIDLKPRILSFRNFLHGKLRSLFTDRRRQSLFFDDEHFIYTWSLQTDSLENAKQIGKSKVHEAYPDMPADTNLYLYHTSGVEAVAAWFYEHLEGSVPIIVLQSQSKVSPLAETFVIVDQLKNLSVSDSTTTKGRRLEVLNVDAYFKAFWQHDSSVSELYASLAQSLAERAEAQNEAKESQHLDISGKKGGKGTSSYKEHLPVHLLEADVASGALRAGVFHVNRRDPLAGYLHPSNKGEASRLNISIPGRLLQNRALPGDLVVVRILERGLWLEAKQTLSQPEISSASLDPLGSLKRSDMMDEDETVHLVGGSGEEIEDVNQTVAQEALPIGEVVGILQRFQRDYVACLAEADENLLRQSGSSRREHLLCVPMDRQVPMVRVATRLGDRLVGQRFIIRIDGWDQDSRTPRGHFVRILGPIGDLNSETMALLVENGINTSPFSSASLQDLPEDTKEHPWIVPDEEFAHRRDLRFSHRTCSIDPPGSKDVDDALSIRRLPNSLLEIGVHIADVSYFVQQDSLVDLEARARGTTVYMVGKSWHMLPGILSENLCSLNGGKDRLAVSVLWTVDPDNEFEVLDVWFGRTVIQSRHQMFYAQAQAILDGQMLPPGWELVGGLDEVAAVASDLLILAKFSQLRRDIRKSNGALELASSELRFVTATNKEPISVDTKLELPMNWIVAEMMILANSYVAQKIYQAFPSRALLRRHDPPRLDNFTLMLECCAARGFTLDTSSNKALAISLDRMRDSNDPVVENAFRALATRAMSEAEYCSTGEATDASGFYHYGLALHFYTHFTSPIRRYADVLVHRLLMASCEGNPGLEITSSEELSSRILDSLLPAMELKEVIHHLNERHRASKRAQKECNELYLLMYLQKHAQAEHGVVSWEILDPTFTTSYVWIQGGGLLITMLDDCQSLSIEDDLKTYIKIFSLVISIHEKGMMVFVPKYDVHVSVYLQDKKGNIILPAEDDSMLNELDESLMPTVETRVLLKQPGSMKITDIKTRKVLHDYKLMDTVWVQLRADGSRAHAPKLRVRLLSPAHPAAKESVLQRAGGSPKRYFLRKDDVKLQSGQSNQVTRKVHKNKVVSDMVQIVAAEEASRMSSTTLMEKVALKRKTPSIHDVTEDFKRLKASSVYLDVIENYGILNVLPSFNVHQLNDKHINVSQGRGKAHCDDFVKWMPMTIGMKLSMAALHPEQQLVEQMRRVWQKKLSQAAKVRAIHLWSILQEECQKQLLRTDRENHMRSRARILGLRLL